MSLLSCPAKHPLHWANQRQLNNFLFPEQKIKLSNSYVQNLIRIYDFFLNFRNVFSTETLFAAILFMQIINFDGSLKILFVLRNKVDPDEFQRYAAFHLGLHCLLKHSGVTKYTKRYTACTVFTVWSVGNKGPQLSVCQQWKLGSDWVDA